MRKQINPTILVNSWPPPAYRNHRKTEWNPERFSSWVKFTMASHQVRNIDLINMGMKETTVQSLRKGKNEPRNGTIQIFCEYITKLSKKEDVSYSSLLKSAYNAMKPYNQD